MPPNKRLLLNGYVVAIWANFVILGFLLILQPYFGGNTPIFLFLMAVAFATWRGGFRAGFLATALSALASHYFLMEPFNSFQLADKSEPLRLALFWGLGGALSMFIWRLRQNEQRALREMTRHQERLLLALRVGRAGAWSWEAASDSAEVTDFDRDLYGFPPGHRVTLGDWLAAVHPEDRELCRAHNEEMLRTGEESRIEFRIIHPKRGVRWIDAIGQAELDAHGRPTRAEGINLDITERKEAEQATARLAAIVSSSSDSILSTTLEGNITSWNKSSVRMFGYTVNEIIHQSIRRLIPPERQAEEDNIVVRLKAGEIIENYETVRLAKDGHRLDVALTISSIKDSAGNIIGVSKSIRDISVRKQAEAALRDSEEKLRAVMENMVEGVITIDERGAMQFANLATERLFGYSLSELNGQNISMLMPEPYHSLHDGYLANYLRTGDAKIIGIGREVTGRRKDGSTFPMDLAVSEFWLGNGRYFTGLVRDISERKAAEAQIRYFADELQVRNTELERSNQELDDFAYIASHDLKEPLRGIHNYASFLKEDHGDKLDTDGLAKLETIGRLAQRLEGLIDSLLIFSRVGRVDLAIQETDLQEVVKDVLNSLAISLQDFGVEVRIPNPLPSLRCDHARIAEVFRNLVTNAMKYNDKPKKWIEIGYSDQASTLEDGNVPSQIVFYVRDNGIGIREKHLESVFRIFKRLHAHDQFGGGTGAGLTIVKKIVERHSGRIWVESTYGEGTTFYFTLANEE